MNAIEHLNTDTCCGYKFTAQDIVGRLMGQQEALGTSQRQYGGKAQRFAHSSCPECSTKYILWLAPKAPSYKVLTISLREDAGETEGKPHGELDIEDMDADQLRQYLKQRGIRYYHGATEQQLRDKAKSA